MEEVEYSGYWWLPSNEENKVGGTFRFSTQDGIQLSLLGSFREPFDQSSPRAYPLVLGLTREGKLLTLCDCMERGLRWSMPGFPSQELLASMAYIGAEFADPAEPQFHKLQVQYSRLADWVGVSGLRTRLSVKNEHRLDKYELTYAFPEKVKATTAKGKVSVTYTFQSEGDLLREVKLRQSVWMQIELQEELPFEEWHSQFIYPLQNLLSLATARPNSIVDVVVYSRQKTVSVGKDDVRERPIEVIFPTRYHEIEQGKPLMPGDMLFALPDVADDFGTVIERWLGVADELDSVCDLFFSVQYSPKMYLHHQFLNVVQAAESYHRRRRGNEALPEEEHKSRIDSILATTEERYREWLAEKLKWSNEPSLRHRIKELIDVTDEVVSPLVPSKTSFIQKVLDTRNFLIHQDASLEAKAARGVELYQLTETLSYLVQACLLRELGFSSERCVELFRRNQRYVFAMRQAQQAGC